MADENFPIKGFFQWTFYIIGLLIGLLNVSFWAYQALGYFIHDKKKDKMNFFNEYFYKRTFYWGLIITLGIMTLIILAILLSFVISGIQL